MKSKKGYTVALLGLLLASVWFYSRGHDPMLAADGTGIGHRPVAAKPSSSATGAGQATGWDHRLPSQSPPSGTDMEALRRDLASADDRAWTANYPTLMRMPVADLYQLLSRPDIAAQPQAKRLYRFMMMGCAVALGELDVGAPRENSISHPFQREWCLGLLPLQQRWTAQAGGGIPRRADELEKYRPFVLEKAAFGAGWGAGDSAEHKAVRLDRSRALSRSSDDPFLVRLAVDHLLDGERPELVPDAAAWHRLPPSQQSYVRLAAQALASCEVARACGPGVILSNYCIFPGLNCQPGMTVAQVAQNSLSPNQWAVLTGIMNEFRRQRMPASGP